VPHTDAAVSLNTQTSPTGKMLYTVSGEDYLQTSVLPGNTQSTHKVTGKFLILGTVTDEEGNPVDGAAVAIDGETVYSNTAGQFQARVKTSKAVTVEVLTAEFLSGTWECAQKASTAAPGKPVALVVNRKGKS
jgi:hypothetical protein